MSLSLRKRSTSSVHLSPSSSQRPRNLPTGSGLLGFGSLDDAVLGAEAIADDYEAHARGAREIAERHLDSDLVLGRLLDELGLGA